MDELNAATELISAGIFDLNTYLSGLANRLAGRYQTLDDLVALVVTNNLLKAGIIGACFFAAWHEKKTVLETTAARRTLITTLFALGLVLALTRVLSQSVLIPRSFVQSQKIYYLDDGQLIENQRVAYRLPLDERSRSDFDDLANGDIDTNNLGSFPSDHAAFFLALSMGIWFASRRFGLIALTWTLSIIYTAKLINGQHTLLDLVVGGILGISILVGCQILASGAGRQVMDRLSHWTLRNRVLTSGLLFIVVFELTSTLSHVRELLKFAARSGAALITG